MTQENSLLAQRFLKPNVSSQTNDFHARADSNPPDERSEEGTLVKYCFARSSACSFPKKHTHTQTLGLAIQMWCKLQIYTTSFPSWMEK